VTVKEPLHTRVAGWLERAFNPIMVKELRASMRGARFFIVHLTILSFFAAALLLTLGIAMSANVGYGRSEDPARVGQIVYVITQLVHLGVVFLVVPGLAATSITGERESQTFDLLVSTSMTAPQVVWGKFTAAMTQTFTIFVSMVPLVGLCFLFGGITIYQIVANYVFHFALSAAMIAFALSISANAKATQRAVGTVYGLALFLGIFVVFAIVGVAERVRILTDMAVAYGFLPPGQDVRGSDLTVFERVMYVHVMPAFAWTALFSVFLINATNRLKPLFANRSTNLRIYYMAVLFASGALMLATFYHEMPPDTNTGDRAAGVMGYAIGVLTASLVSALFACEDPVQIGPFGVRTDTVTGIRRLFAFLRPGSESGAVYTVVVNVLFLAVSFLALLPYAAGFGRGSWAGLPDFYPLALAFVCVALWVWFVSGFARFLSVVFWGRPVLLRTVLVLVCLGLAVLPIIHWAISTEIDRNEDLDPEGRRGPISLALSPAAAVVSVLDLATLRRDFPLMAGPLPVPALFAVFALCGGTLFFVLAGRANARLRAALAQEARDHSTQRHKDTKPEAAGA
jgi:ABC-type transport system involved in multi-copper enzyme maturation permease subunit